MLRSLRVRNLVILEDVTLEFAPGLNLLTGETGAGKSILIDAVGLATGDRADRSLVRAGADSAVIEALFEVTDDGATVAWARARGIEFAGGEVLVRREIGAAGGNRNWLNGSPCTQGILGELGARLIDLHGQHEQQSLLSAERHLELLDRWGGHAELLAATAAACRSHGERRRALDALRQALAERQARIDRLETTVREVDAVAPRPGEIDELTVQCRLLKNAARMAELLDTVVAAAYEGEPSAAGLASAAARSARQAAEFDPALVELATRLESAALELGDAGAAFRDYREAADFDPARADRLEERRAALTRLCQRYGIDETGLLAAREAAALELAQLGDADRALADAESALAAVAAEYATQAAALGQARRRSAERLAPAVAAQLGELALGRARIDVAFQPAAGEAVPGHDGTPLAVSERGAERAELLLAANPGEPLRPLRKVASGGELSRLMLALHGVFESAGEDRALVFDEVDAGVGGAVADAVGRRLRRLAARHQVLCVTHLPQVAAYADRHFSVRKTVSGGRTRAVVCALTAEEQVEELARMLGGRSATDASRRHAAELLSGAAGAVRPRRARPTERSV